MPDKIVLSVTDTCGSVQLDLGQVICLTLKHENYPYTAYQFSVVGLLSVQTILVLSLDLLCPPLFFLRRALDEEVASYGNKL